MPSQELEPFPLFAGLPKTEGERDTQRERYV
jgi:hypothetical protein